MQEKKMTHKDAIEKSAYDAMIYKNIIKQISTKELKKALKMLKEMPKTRTKIRLIEQELRVREQGEVKNRGGLPIELLNEWDRVTEEIRKRVKNGIQHQRVQQRESKRHRDCVYDPEEARNRTVGEGYRI